MKLLNLEVKSNFKKIFASLFCILIFLLSTFFVSCKDLANSNFETQELYTVSGKILPSDMFSEIENARTAMPDFQGRTLTYSIEAEKSENFQTGEKIQGSFENDSTNFYIKLALGKWTLTAKGILNGQTVCVGSKTIELTQEKPVVNGLSIELLEVYGGGTGTVNLTLNVGSSSKVKSVQADWSFLQGSSAPGTSSNTAVFNVESNGNVVINKLSSFPDSINFPAGAYNLKLYFWSGTYDESTKSSGMLLYTLEEIVNVFSGIETNTWQGNSVYFSESDGKKSISISDDMITNFLKTTLYVGNNSVISTSPSDSNTGTFFDPFETVQKAVDRIVEMEILNHNTSYIIYVSGNVTGGADFSKLNSSLSKNSLLIDLRKNSSSSTTPTITASNSQVIKMPSVPSSSSGTSSDTNFSLNISGINLSGGSQSVDGSIVEVSAKTTLKLIDCEIKNNTVGSKGAVYVSGGSLFLGGKITITENKTSNVQGANVYLSNDKKITLDTTSSLSLSSHFNLDSRIGVTTETKPTATSSKVQITSGTGTGFISSFSSDEGYTVVQETSGLSLAVSSGNISVKQIDDVIFEISPTSLSKTGGDITVKAKVNSTEITNKLSNWNLKIYYFGVDTKATTNNNTINVNGDWPNGTYQLFVSATYNGITYSSYFDFEKRN